jgi:hypothetical protein
MVLWPEARESTELKKEVQLTILAPSIKVSPRMFIVEFL